MKGIGSLEEVNQETVYYMGKVRTGPKGATAVRSPKIDLRPHCPSRPHSHVTAGSEGLVLQVHDCQPDQIGTPRINCIQVSVMKRLWLEVVLCCRVQITPVKSHDQIII
jgi:hypothetical protein